MQYEELHHRYGGHVAQRVRHELTPTEFQKIRIEELAQWLEARAETAHAEYRRLLSNPADLSHKDSGRTGNACRRWREAEDIAYLVAVAEDAGVSYKTSSR